MATKKKVEAKKPAPKKKSVAKKIAEAFGPVFQAPPAAAPLRRYRLLANGKLVEHPEGEYVKFEEVG